MRKLIAISVASTILGYAAVYFVFFSKPAPQPQPEPAAAQPEQPVVLANVVDVTDVEPLLDPKPHEPVGAPFDPNFHQALAQEPSSEHPAGTITRATQAGFKLHDRVIRPAQVFVSTGPANKST